MTFEEIVGIIVGLVFWYLWAFVNITMTARDVSTITDSKSTLQLLPIHTWVFAGPIIFFLISGRYLISRGVIDDRKKMDDIISIKSSLIGFFLWLALMIFAYFLNIQVDPNASDFGGFVTILLIYLYMEKRVSKAQNLTDLTFTKLILIYMLLNTILTAFNFFSRISELW
jgi:hypothetical protein